MQSGCQQHELTEASQQNIANRSRNSLRSRREGRQQIKLNNGKEVLAQGEYVPTDLAIKNKVCLNYHVFKGDVNYYNLRIVEDLKCNQN